LALQWLFAGTWVLMLGSLPFIMPVLDGKEVTKTQVGVGATMTVVLFGGVFLFTNIILFQSIHFKTIRPLTLVECIYFMAQVITTVGYGDITPAKIRGQVFVGLYVLGALFVIAMLISDLTNHLVIKARHYKEELIAQKEAAMTPRESARHRKSKGLHHLIVPEKPSLQPLMVSLSVFCGLVVCWVAMFSLAPGEGKTVFQALYMAVITYASVGFGWFTPVTEAGMIFGAFFMLLGSGALVNVIGCFTELMVNFSTWERFKPESAVASMEQLKGLVAGSDNVDYAQFLQFSLLQMKGVSKTQLAGIQQAFDNLNPKNGIITFESVRHTLVDAEVAADSDAK